MGFRKIYLLPNSYELPSGLGRMDILLTRGGQKYIIETKVNRYEDIQDIIDEGLEQLAGKYLTTESENEDYLVIYDTRSTVGERYKTQDHCIKDRMITSFTISIGRPG